MTNKIKWGMKSNEKWNQMKNRLKEEMKSNEIWNQMRNRLKRETKSNERHEIKSEMKWNEK